MKPIAAHSSAGIRVRRLTHSVRQRLSAPRMLPRTGSSGEVDWIVELEDVREVPPLRLWLTSEEDLVNSLLLLICRRRIMGARMVICELM